MSVESSFASSAEIPSTSRTTHFILDLSQSLKKRRRSETNQLKSPSKRKMTPIATLRDFLEKKSRVQAFRVFLQKEFSEENLEFWIEVESYKKQKHAKQLKLAQNLYDIYIRPGAKRELNIDEQTRRETEANLTNPNSTTFDLSQKKVFTLMERDSFRRFSVQEWNSRCDENTAPLGGQSKIGGKKSRPVSRFGLSLRAAVIEKRKRRSAAA